MRIVWSNNGLQQLWLAPFASGILLLLISLLIFYMPEILAYVVAAVFLFAGISLCGVGLSVRGNTRTHYRRVDNSYVHVEDRPE